MGSIALPRKLKHVNPIPNPTHPQVLVIWREVIKYVNSVGNFISAKKINKALSSRVIYIKSRRSRD